MKYSATYSRLILFIAITMMVVSALISYFLVMRNNPTLAMLKMQAQDKQALIRDVWNNIGRKESVANTLILLTVLSNKDNSEAVKVKQHYLEEFPEVPKNAGALAMLTAVERAKTSDIDYINTIYLEQTTLQNNIAEIERHQKQYADIAFFLQILSLVLIIVRRDVMT